MSEFEAGKNKIFCFLNGGNPLGYIVVALAHNGRVLASHCSSNETWAKHDIGLNSNWKHEHYNAEFGDGNWELEWLDKPDENEEFLKAAALNEQIPDECEGN